jgi:uncharacterized protein DUF4159
MVSKGPSNRTYHLSGLSLTLTLVTIVSISGTLRAEISAEAVSAAIARGVKHLENRQSTNGTWPDYTSTFPGGTTALCTLALLESGETEEKNPKLRAALGWLRSRTLDRTYTVALQTMVLCKASSDRDRLLIKRNVEWLERSQVREGSESGGWAYPAALPGHLADNSNSQFALLALDAAARVGVKVRESTWLLARDYWATGQDKNGSWGYYRRTKGAGTGSMTCAGVSSMKIVTDQIARGDSRVRGERIICCGGGRSEGTEQIERGIDWLAKHFSLSTNPGTTSGEWRLYYLYGLERVGRLTSIRFIGDHDWYREGAERLVRRTIAGANYWSGRGNEKNDLISTSFALLFLSKGRRPVLISKLRYGDTDSDWNPQPQSIANLTRYVESRWHKDMTWQTIDLRTAAVDDLLQSPVLFLGGSTSPLPSDETRINQLAEKLRGYLDRGGFLFADAQCEGTEFDRGFRALINRIFPEREYRLRLLDPGHSIWQAEEPIAPKWIRPLWGVDFGCRTSVVYAPPSPGLDTDRPTSVRPSLACLWELAQSGKEKKYSQTVKQRIAAGLSIGINVLAYATDRQLKPKDAIPSDLTPEAERGIDGRGEVSIATLRHPGGCSVAPRAVVNLLERASKQLGLRTRPDQILVPISDPRLFDYHLVFMHGRTSFSLTDRERKQLRTYIQRGGMLLADSICASNAFSKSFRREIEAIFPERPLESIPLTDPMLSSQYGGYDVRQLTQTKRPDRSAKRGAEKSRREKRPVRLEGIRIGDRWAVVFSPLDISCALDGHSGPECQGYSREDAARLGINILLYSLQQ